MANDEIPKGKAKGNNNDNSQQTLTVSFTPESEHYERPKNMEEHIRCYFEGINGLSKRIIAEERKIVAQNRNTWPTLSIEERDRLLNDRLVSSDVRQKYNNSEEFWQEKAPSQTGKLVKDEEIAKTNNTAKDSFSRPFLWTTKSQRNISFPAINKQKLNSVQETKHVEEKSKKSAAKKITEVENDKLLSKETRLKDNKAIGSREKDVIPKSNYVAQQHDTKPSTAVTTAVSTTVIKDDGEKRLSEEKTMKKEDNEEQGESSMQQVKPDETQYLDGTKNIFEFLQSWDP